MDLSKLPRMSQTPPQPQQTDPPAAPEPAPDPRAGRFSDPSPVTRSGAIGGAEAWISIAIGAIVLYWFQRVVLFALDPSTTRFDAITPTGTLPYLRSIFFPYDLGGFLFGLALVVEGLVMLLVPRRPAFAVSLALMALAVAANVWALLAALPINGFQLTPALFIAIGVYLAIYQWRLVRDW